MTQKGLDALPPEVKEQVEDRVYLFAMRRAIQLIKATSEKDFNQPETKKNIAKILEIIKTNESADLYEFFKAHIYNPLFWKAAFTIIHSYMFAIVEEASVTCVAIETPKTPPVPPVDPDTTGISMPKIDCQCDVLRARIKEAKRLAEHAGCYEVIDALDGRI
jgi:hypothetical protein